MVLNLAAIAAAVVVLQRDVLPDAGHGKRRTTAPTRGTEKPTQGFREENKQQPGDAH